MSSYFCIISGKGMEKKKVEYTDYLNETIKVMNDCGLLLVSQDKNSKPNVMAIGWGTIGIIWGKPVFVVLVRLSRYTYGLIEQTGDFTVNVPSKEMADIVEYCGEVSGRNHDKFFEKGITAIPGKIVKSPIIKECPINYECKVVHKNDVLKKELTEEIKKGYYADDDYHRVYFGEILYVHGGK